MYIQIPQDYRCSGCGKLNMIEYVERGYVFGKFERYIKCTVCGHEKLTSTITTNANTNTTEAISYNANYNKDPITF